MVGSKMPIQMNYMIAEFIQTTLKEHFKSKTKFELLRLSVYLVGNWLVGVDKLKSKESAIIRRSLLIFE